MKLNSWGGIRTVTPTASLSLKKHIEERLGWLCSIPTYLTVERL